LHSKPGFFCVFKANIFSSKGVWDFKSSYFTFQPKAISKASCIISGLSFCSTNLSRCVRILLEAFLNLSNQNLSHLSFCVLSSLLTSVFISCNSVFWASSKSGNCIKLLMLLVIVFCFTLSSLILVLSSPQYLGQPS
jgi:hypothetical protein